MFNLKITKEKSMKIYDNHNIILLFYKIFVIRLFLARNNSCLIIPNREHMTDQDTLNYNSMSFIGVTCRNEGEQLLAVTEMTKRHLYH